MTHKLNKLRAAAAQYMTDIYRGLVRGNRSAVGFSKLLYSTVEDYRREMARICGIRHEIRERIERLPSFVLMDELVDVFCRTRKDEADMLRCEAREDTPEMACDMEFVIREHMADAICDTLSYEGKSPEKFLVNTLLKEALA